MIKRESILGMIGAEKYHSCICTTYSFDFLYFEMKVMRALGGAGVQNVTVLVDGKYYGTLMEQPTLQEHAINNRYALYPIFSTGIFHPKIMMLFGKKEGLLIIGSGNLTSSGLGGNDEIWGAFHFSSVNPQHAGLLKLAWTYLQSFTSKAKGVVQLKTGEWIERNTSWLSELPNVTYGEMFSYGKGQSLTLLWQQKSLRLYEQIRNNIAGKTVEEITVISPYYDKDGLILERYAADYVPKNVKVVMDETGLLPVDFSPTASFSFYDWKEVAKTDEEARRLHGKLHHFRCSDGSEYLFFGSANATPEGLGIGGYYHEEAGLFIFSQHGGLLGKVGIDLTRLETCSLTDFTPAPVLPMNSSTGLVSFKYKITAAEKEEGELSFYLLDECKETITIKGYSQDDKTIFQEKVSQGGQFFQIKVNKNILLHTIQLFSEDCVRVISPRVIVHDVLQMLKTNPDPKTRNFEIAINDFKSSDDSNMIIELLHYVLDESMETDPLVARHRAAGFVGVSENNGHATELKDISTFSVEQINHHRVLMLSPSLTVADLLKFAFVTKRGNREEDLKVEEQETNADSAQGDTDAQKEKSPITLEKVRSERQKIVRYFERLSNHYYDRSHVANSSKEYKLTLSDLARFVISLNLINEYVSKYVPEVLEGNRIFCYLKEDNELHWYDNLKSLMLGLTGWFLQVCIEGMEAYEYEYTKRKFDELKHEALLKTITLLCRTNWVKGEEQCFQSLLFNTLVYLGSKTEGNAVAQEILKHLESIGDSAFTKSNRFKDNRSILLNKVLPAYLRLTANLSKPVNERFLVSNVKAGDAIFSSRVGVGYISTHRNGTVDFVRPGLEWNNDLGGFKSLQIKQTKFVPVIINCS